jgi:hypothetical protein
MSVLGVNLKHLYQRRGLWLAYVVFGLLVFAAIAIPLDGPSAGKGRFMGFVMLEFLIGLCIASLHIEMLTKPFSYCLPGHRAVPRKFVFSVAVATSLPGSLIFLAYPHLHWWQWAPVTCCAAFCAGLIMYWAGVGLVFGGRNSGSRTGFAGLPICGVLFFDLHVVAERVIVNQPFAIVLLGLMSSVVAWFWLGNSNWARRFCAVPRIGFLDAWDQNKLKKHAQKRAAVKWDKFKNHPDPWVERFFLGRMNNCNHLGPGRYIWGGLYTTYGIALSRWKEGVSWLLLALVMLVYLSYSQHGGTYLFFFLAGSMARQMRLPVYSTMITSGGRKERYAAAFILAGTITVLITVAMAVVAAISIALAPIMPDFTLRSANLTFHATSLRFLVVPFMIIPIVLAFRLIIFRKPVSTIASIILVIALMFVFGITSLKALRLIINPMSITILVILSWLILVVVLRHICMKRSLAGQGNTY